MYDPDKSLPKNYSILIPMAMFTRVLNLLFLSGNCDFEDDTCAWVQAQDDDFDWVHFRGSTSSGATGPTGDHTTGSGKT